MESVRISGNLLFVLSLMVSGPTWANEGRIVQRPLSQFGVRSVHCGLDSLLAVSNALGRRVPFESLYSTTRYLSSPRASTGDDLSIAASDFGFHTAWVSSLSFDSLSLADSPMILQLKATTNKEQYHWVAFLGSTSKGVIILDSPGQPSTWTREELNLLWTGKGLICATTRSQVAKEKLLLQAYDLMIRFTWVAIAMLAFIALQFVTRQYKNNSMGIRLCKPLIIIVLPLLWAITLIAFTNERSLSREDIYAYAAWNGKNQSPQYVRDIAQVPGCLVVDCRLKGDFMMGHLPNAISLPVSAGFVDWRRFANSVPDNTVVVVYCQSAHCPWAETAQHRFRLFGVQSKILVGGFERFVTEVKIAEVNDCDA